MRTEMMMRVGLLREWLQTLPGDCRVYAVTGEREGFGAAVDGKQVCFAPLRPQSDEIPRMLAWRLGGKFVLPLLDPPPALVEGEIPVTARDLTQKLLISRDEDEAETSDVSNAQKGLARWAAQRKDRRAWAEEQARHLRSELFILALVLEAMDGREKEG